MTKVDKFAKRPVEQYPSTSSVWSLKRNFRHISRVNIGSKLELWTGMVSLDFRWVKIIWDCQTRGRKKTATVELGASRSLRGTGTVA